MHTIVLATQKGGSGKSTLAIGLALAASEAGHTVRLIDADPQGTLASWQRRRTGNEPIVETVSSYTQVEQRLQAFVQSGVTLTIVDTAGGLAALTSAAIRGADLCLIPVRPSHADIEAAAPTLSNIRSYDKPFAFVLNQTPSRGSRIGNASSALGDEATSAIGDVIASPFIALRNDHQDALGHGQAVTEYASTGKSAEEIRGLWRWIDGKLATIALADEQRILADEADALPVEPTIYWRAPVALSAAE